MGGTPHMATWLISVGALLAVSVLGGALLMAVRKPFADEIGYQIDRFPERLFFIALRFFPEDERERRYDQWAEDYQELSDTYENRTLIRVFKCTQFSLSLLTRSGFIGRRTRDAQGRQQRMFATGVMFIRRYVLYLRETLSSIETLLLALPIAIVSLGVALSAMVTTFAEVAVAVIPTMISVVVTAAAFVAMLLTHMRTRQAGLTPPPSSPQED